MKSTIACAMAILLLSAAGYAQGPDVPAAVAVASDGVVYVAGTSMNAAGAMEYVLIAYDRAGNELGVKRLPATAGGTGIPVAIGIAGNSVLVTGTAAGSGGAQDIVTASFARFLVSAESPPQAPGRLQLHQSYPNPLTSDAVATIGYTVPAAGNIRLRVVDLAGKEVAQLENGYRETGEYKALFKPGVLPAGTYFYVLTSSSTTEIRRLAVVR